MKYFTVLTLILSVVCCVYAEEAGKGWFQFDLKKTQVGIATIYYDPMYEDKLDLIKSSFEDYLVKYKAVSALHSKKDDIVKDINTILGETDDHAEGQAKTLLAYIKLVSQASEMRFFIISGTKVKDFLRKGGTLPDYTYNKEDDTCTYRFGLENSAKNKKPVNSFELALPIVSDDDFEKNFAERMKAISNLTGTGIEPSAIHEVAELTLQLRIKAINPYLRWFSDGTANLITYELLKKHISPQLADQFLKDRDIEKFKELTTEINLQYWMLAKYCIDGVDDDIKFPRYCFALHEMRWLVEKHGIGCIKEIIDEMCKHKEQPNDLLLNVIKKVTGEDMSERLKKYQTFETREEGMEKYSNKVGEAMKNKDTKSFITSSLRMLEMFEHPYEHKSITTRKMIAQVLTRTGNKKLGDKTMNGLLEMMEIVKLEKAREATLSLYIDYALNTGRPGIAVKQAEDMLMVSPNNVPALGIKMLTLANNRKITQAKPFAEKILKHAKKEDQFYGLAQKVIRIAESQKANSSK